MVFVQETSEGYQLVRNGEPFYMKGGAAHYLYLEELKEAGANTARIYDTINLKKTLDVAESLGLAVVVDIPLPKFHTDPYFYEDEISFNRLKRRVKRVVQQHKNHPALLYWNLGNELYYPYLYKRTTIHSRFNELIDLIHQLDPNHPVSTTTIGANKLRVLSIKSKSPQLDIISFNSFGSLSSFSRKLKPISPFWKGPHVITEWGVNGPWEAQMTSWKAPIEETSTKKAELIRQRYFDYMVPLQSNNSLGSFVFYWGFKNEVTPTWYSLFNKNKEKTQAVYELSKIWSNHDLPFQGPEIDYMLLDGKGAAESVILLPEKRTEVQLTSSKQTQNPFTYHWEVRHESWNKTHESIVVEEVTFDLTNNKAIFTTPIQEGPYRVFVEVRNGSEFIATANFPFYVLKTPNGV